MPNAREIVRWEHADAAPVAVGPLRLVARSRSLVVRLPFGGLVWHRPVAVRVERDGTTTELPIRDLTRTAQLALFGLALAALAVARAARRG
jgi:hypothetical protein